MYVYPLMYDSFDIFGLWFKRQTNRDGTIVVVSLATEIKFVLKFFRFHFRCIIGYLICMQTIQSHHSTILRPLSQRSNLIHSLFFHLSGFSAH